jgi:hypothetical protein
MALKTIRPILILSFSFILLVTSIPGRSVHGRALHRTRLSVLDVFIGQITNGHANELRGVYIPEILAAPVVQQPDGRHDFVSFKQKEVTQFSLASNLGATGLLAHNYLAGKSFSLLEKGWEVDLIYGDGRVSAFRVTQILRYQAQQPTSTSSEFVNLQNGGLQTAAEVFTEIYNRPGQVILQTCISAHGSFSWGRLFIIAEPSYAREHSASLNAQRP